MRIPMAVCHKTIRATAAGATKKPAIDMSGEGRGRERRSLFDVARHEDLRPHARPGAGLARAEAGRHLHLPRGLGNPDRLHPPALSRPYGPVHAGRRLCRDRRRRLGLIIICCRACAASPARKPLQETSVRGDSRTFPSSGSPSASSRSISRASRPPAGPVDSRTPPRETLLSPSYEAWQAVPMTHFRKKPVDIRAVQWRGDNWDEVAAFHSSERLSRNADGTSLSIVTLEGIMQAQAGDWIIEGVQGELYPCKPDIFEATYERAPGTDDR